MRITLHRPHQIGGCITEIESNAGTKIFIDLGHLLPDGDKPSDDKLATKDAIDKLTAGAAAILYTHNHGDHVELFNLVDESIPQYIGNLAADLMGRKYQRLSCLDDQHEECMDRLMKLENFHFYRAGKPLYFGKRKDITVTPFYVSHSATDSHMLKIQCDGKTVIHTGDFREHGYLGEGLRRVIDKFHIAGNVDVLIVEGTNVGQPYKPVKSEQEVCNCFKEIMAKRKNVFVLCSSQDADRLEFDNTGNLYGKARPENFPMETDYRNPLISGVMRALGFVNRFGMDIGLVADELKENGNPPAEYILSEPSSFKVIVRSADPLSEQINRGQAHRDRLG